MKTGKIKKIAACESCYWAYPESYSHIAMLGIRRLDLLWMGDEVAEYDKLRAQAEKEKKETPEYVKNLLRKLFY